VDGCPYVIGCTDVITLLGGSQNTLLEGLILPSPHRLPTTGFDFILTFYNGIVFDALSSFVHRDLAFIQRDVDRVSIRVARKRGLEESRNACRIPFRQSFEIVGKFCRNLFARQSLAGRDDVVTRRHADIHIGFLGWLLKHWIHSHCFSKANEEINRILVRRFPLVGTKPALSGRLIFGCNGAHTRCEDQTVCFLFLLCIQ